MIYNIGPVLIIICLQELLLIQMLMTRANGCGLAVIIHILGTLVPPLFTPLLHQLGGHLRKSTPFSQKIAALFPAT